VQAAVGRERRGRARICGTSTGLVAWIGGLAALACAAPLPAPRFAPTGTEPGALQPLRDSGFPLAQARPDRSLAAYDAVWLRVLEPSYRVPPRTLARRGGTGSGNYALPGETLRRIGLVVREAFERELVDEAGLRAAHGQGGDVLEARIALVDLVIDQPLDASSASDTAVAGSVGAFTLVVDLHDSLSGERIARVAERRRIAAVSSRPMRIRSGDAIYETGRLARSSARRLRRFLEAMVLLEPDPAARAAAD